MPKDFPRARMLPDEKQPMPDAAPGSTASPFSHRPADSTPSKGGETILPPRPVTKKPPPAKPMGLFRRPGSRKQ